MKSETVSTLLRGLAEERARTFEPAALQAAAARRAHAVAWAAANPAVPAGTVLKPFDLEEVDTGTLGLSDLTRSGPAVLLFFRFAGCSVCNLVLPHYGRSLAPQLARMNVPLVAISPQPSVDLAAIKHTHKLPFHVAYDPNNGLARQLGITFLPEEPPEGTDLTELPHPTFVVVDGAGTVRWIEVRPDWMAWVDADVVVEEVKRVSEAAEPGRG